MSKNQTNLNMDDFKWSDDGEVLAPPPATMRMSRDQFAHCIQTIEEGFGGFEIVRYIGFTGKGSNRLYHFKTLLPQAPRRKTQDIIYTTYTEQQLAQKTLDILKVYDSIRRNFP
jgi:hypothetical protein